MKFDNRVYSSREAGLTLKWVECSLLNAYRFFVGDEQGYKTNSKEQSFYMDVDKLKVVLGSYLFGMLFAFIALAIERYSNKLNIMNPKIDQAIKVIKVTSTVKVTVPNDSVAVKIISYHLLNIKKVSLDTQDNKSQFLNCLVTKLNY